MDKEEVIQMIAANSVYCASDVRIMTNSELQEFLDDFVIDQKMEEASNLNNEGMEAQMRFLVSSDW